MSEKEHDKTDTSKTENMSQKPEDQSKVFLDAYAKILDIWKGGVRLPESALVL